MGNVSLKPCPFCSSWSLEWGNGSFVCRGCGVEFGTWDTQEEANAAWNLRRVEEAQAAEITRLRAENQHMKDGLNSIRQLTLMFTPNMKIYLTKHLNEISLVVEGLDG